MLKLQSLKCYVSFEHSFAYVCILVGALTEDPTSETSVRWLLALTRTNSSVPAGGGDGGNE